MTTQRAAHLPHSLVFGSLLSLTVLACAGSNSAQSRSTAPLEAEVKKPQQAESCSVLGYRLIGATELPCELVLYEFRDTVGTLEFTDECQGTAATLRVDVSDPASPRVLEHVSREYPPHAPQKRLSPVGGSYTATGDGRSIRFENDQLTVSNPNKGEAPASLTFKEKPLKLIDMADRTLAMSREGIEAVDISSPSTLRSLGLMKIEGLRFERAEDAAPGEPLLDMGTFHPTQGPDARAKYLWIATETGRLLIAEPCR